MKKKVIFVLTLIWLVLEIYFLHRMYVETSTGSMKACDYLGACMFFTPLFFPFLLFIIWKPENRGWIIHTLFSILATVFIVIFILLVLAYLGK